MACPGLPEPDEHHMFLLILKSDELSIAILFPLTFSNVLHYCFMVHFHFSSVNCNNLKPAEKALVKEGKCICLIQQTLFWCVFLLDIGKCTFPPSDY